MTVKQYIEQTYKEPYKSQILENLETNTKDISNLDITEIPANHPAQILSHLFRYSGTKEGLEYWVNYEEILEREHNVNNS